jgi:hypothetical protein
LFSVVGFHHETISTYRCRRYFHRERIPSPLFPLSLPSPLSLLPPSIATSLQEICWAVLPPLLLHFSSVVSFASGDMPSDFSIAGGLYLPGIRRCRLFTSLYFALVPGGTVADLFLTSFRASFLR